MKQIARGGGASGGSPNAYNDAGDLVGTSDARGCGTNFVYDGLGRLLGEDYSPCEATHAAYSQPSNDTTFAPTLDGWEVAYAYDRPPSGVTPPSSLTFNFTAGRLVAVVDRGAVSFTQYDGLGRVTKTARQIAKPAVPGQTPDAIASRYAPRWYFTATAYDAADRPAYTSAGLRSTQLQGGSTGGIAQATTEPDYTKSTVTSHYTARGTLGTVDGSYGSLLAAIQRRADGLVEQVTYGDLAGTTTATGYDARRRPTGIQTYRAAPGAWSPATTGYTPAPAAGGTNTSFQLLLQDLDISYDIVGNPTEIRDWRDPAEWPLGAKPVTRKMAYDDLYRVRQVKYEYSTNDEQWTSPYQQENGETSTLASRDHRRAMPSPHVGFEHRVLQQDIEYDWLGNTETSDDDAHGFYDRSLGDIRSNVASGKPYQLASASNTEAGGARTGTLATQYDAAGNLTDLAVTRSGSCLPSGASCNQRFHYGWDEVGRLVRAQRWDTATNVNQEPNGTPAVDLAYAYDASDNRVLKSATASEGTNNSVQRHSVYVSGGQELRGAEYKLGNGENGVEDYQLDSRTEIAYLFAHGVRLARVAFDNATSNAMPTFAAGSAVPQQHVLINLGDTLGSTALVIDKATGELVESTAYLAFGGTESDYRPDRWKGLREDYRFTGKEEDVEVGLQYFGKRFLSPYLGRWVSADPLAVHSPGKADWNLYSYAKGSVLKYVDPLGLTVITNGPDPITEFMHEAQEWYYKSAAKDFESGSYVSGTLKAAAGAIIQGGPAIVANLLPVAGVVGARPGAGNPRNGAGPTKSPGVSEAPAAEGVKVGVRPGTPARATTSPAVAQAVESQTATTRVTSSPATEASPTGLEAIAQKLEVDAAGAEESIPAYARNKYSTPSAEAKKSAIEKAPACPYCSVKESDTVDHIRSQKQDWTEGGWKDSKEARSARVNDPDNLTGACRSCNSSKQDKAIGTGEGEWTPPNQREEK